MASQVVPVGRSPRAFLDSNILIYAEDSAHPAKQSKAIAMIAERARARTAVVSLQVLGEYFNNVVRKLHVDPAIAREQVNFYAKFELVVPELEDVFAATDLHRLYGYSYWDCLIVRCAQRAGCPLLFSEDMQHGQVIGGVTILNPFV